MLPRSASQPSVSFDVTVRFDLFYALRALDEGSGDFDEWRKDTERALPRGFAALAKRLAPRPMMWALLADCLRDAPAVMTFTEVIEVIQSLDDDKFQRAVLSGVFRKQSVVDDLVSKRRTLRDIVERGEETNTALLRLLGLYPFRPTSAVAEAFTRLISSPAEYRNEICSAAEMFWTSSFAATWNSIEPEMHNRVRAMQHSLRRSSLADFVRAINLPVVFDDRASAITTMRGVSLFSYREIKEIHVMPSAFNDARFWGAYRDSSKAVRLYFPVFDSSILRRAVPQHRVRPAVRTEAGSIDPSLIFRALGDTTRFAMACILAKSPRTSMELAKEFGVSKATISHHVSVLRSAELLHETPTGKGIALTLDRDALEDLSTRSALAMFSSAHEPVVRRSRRDSKKRSRHTGRNE